MQPLLQWKSIKYYILFVCVCSLRYPARNARAPYCRLWRARVYSIFSTLSHKSYDVGEKKLLNIKCALIFSTRLPEIFLVLWRTERERIKKWYIGFHVKCLFFFLCFNESWIFSRVFRENSNIEFHENPFGGNRVVPCGQKGGQKTCPTLKVAFRHFAKEPNNGQSIFMYMGSVTAYVMMKIAVPWEVNVVRRLCKMAKSDC